MKQLTPASEAALVAGLLVLFLGYLVAVAMRSPFLARSIRADLDALDARVVKLEAKQKGKG